jgi:hypothetical protein
MAVFESRKSAAGDSIQGNLKPSVLSRNRGQAMTSGLTLYPAGASEILMLGHHFFESHQTGSRLFFARG